jgi:hypothetical protein
MFISDFVFNQLTRCAGHYDFNNSHVDARGTTRPPYEYQRGGSCLGGESTFPSCKSFHSQHFSVIPDLCSPPGLTAPNEWLRLRCLGLVHNGRLHARLLLHGPRRAGYGGRTPTFDGPHLHPAYSLNLFLCSRYFFLSKYIFLCRQIITL